MLKGRPQLESLDLGEVKLIGTGRTLDIVDVLSAREPVETTLRGLFECSSSSRAVEKADFGDDCRKRTTAVGVKEDYSREQMVRMATQAATDTKQGDRCHWKIKDDRCFVIEDGDDP